jgi:hypothetical protein
MRCGYGGGSDSWRNKVNAHVSWAARCLNTNAWQHLIATAGRDILAERDPDLEKSGTFISRVNCLYMLCVHLYTADVMSL